MKNTIKMLLFAFLLLTCCSGCTLNSKNVAAKETESIVNKCYGMEDFDAIVIGESTFYDVCAIVPTSKMLVTSYGGLCQYPMNDGRFICVEFYGPLLTVASITMCEA